MKKQLMKGFTMLMLIVALAFVTAVASANGQSRIKADIPFDFVVGDTTLTAGEYSVQSVTAGAEILRLVSVNGKHRSSRLSMPLAGQSTQAKLVFNRYDNKYFLAQIWDPEHGGRQLIKSKQERALARETKNLAQSRFERVEVLASLR